MFVYAVANHKGGVGKTTAAATLGAAFVRLGRRVLLIDLDPQSSLTVAVRARPSSVTIENVIDTPCSAANAIVPCASGMEIIPARATLAIQLQSIAHKSRSNSRLASAIDSLGARFDTVVIDSPSGMGAGLANALTAAHVALVPVKCDYLSLRCVADTLAMCGAIRHSANPRLQMLAFASMFDRRTTYAVDVLAEARARLGPWMVDTVVPCSVRLAEAPAVGTTVLDFAPRSPGAAAYSSLARELLERESHYGTTGRYSSGNSRLAKRSGGRDGALRAPAAAHG